MEVTERIAHLIERYELSPLPGEGGFYRFISRFGAGAGTIYYLITDEEWSHLHMLDNDELWFFLEGNGAEQVTLDEKDGILRRRILSEEDRSSVVGRGAWQATRLMEKGGYAFFSTVMSPAYEDEDWHGPTEDLLERFPEVEEYA